MILLMIGNQEMTRKVEIRKSVIDNHKVENQNTYLCNKWQTKLH